MNSEHDTSAISARPSFMTWEDHSPFALSVESIRTRMQQGRHTSEREGFARTLWRRPIPPLLPRKKMII